MGALSTAIPHLNATVAIMCRSNSRFGSEFMSFSDVPFDYPAAAKLFTDR
jgi:hypothetical protein